MLPRDGAQELTIRKMESSVGALAPSAETQPSARPGWVWTIGWLFLCGVMSGFAVRLTLAGMTYSQLLPEEGWDTTGWPWPISDAWSLAANVGYGLLFGFALAWTMRLAIRGRKDGWDVRLWPIAVATALAFSSEENLAGLTGFALMVVVAREIAMREATNGPSRRATVAIAAVVAGLLVATFTYQPLHPLLASLPGHPNELMLSDFGPSVPPSARELRFRLENAGIGTVTLRSVHVVGPNARLLDVETYGMTLAGANLRRNSDFDGRLRLSKAACATDAARYRIPSASVDALVVRVETLGMVRTQRFHLQPRADLFCGRQR